jgi:hypothetical protein
VFDADAKDESMYADEAEGLTPKVEEDAKPGVEEQLKEEKKLTRKLNARITVLEAAAQKNAAALALGVKCAKQLLSECVCVCVCVFINLSVCLSLYTEMRKQISPDSRSAHWAGVLRRRGSVIFARVVASARRRLVTPKAMAAVLRPSATRRRAKAAARAVRV